MLAGRLTTCSMEWRLDMYKKKGVPGTNVS